MKTVQPGLRACFVATAIAAALAGCGGGGDTSDPMAQSSAASGARMQKLAVIVQPPHCEPTGLALANIDFGQAGWAGDDAPALPVPSDSLVAAALAYTDDPAESHSVTWSWGDGSTTPGSITESSGAGSAAASHTYEAAGVYTVAATIAGNACTTATVTRKLVVYDPSAGFVTGGGWIDSPAGAYAPDPRLAGRANFGFVSKYLKGATVPTGQTEFQFHADKLNFHSQSYDWLVVAGARAQYKGTGSVNGVDGFRFMLTAVDGNLLGAGKAADRFRIRIWQGGGDGADVVVYDNQLDATLEGGTSEGTVIAGGSIVIHK